jgi:hypothetical protein
MTNTRNKEHLKQIFSMYKTFSSIRATEGNKWKLSYIFGNKTKLEKSVDKLLRVRGGEINESRIVADMDLRGYYCFECICETMESATDFSYFLDNQLDEVIAEDTYDYPIQGDDY